MQFPISQRTRASSRRGAALVLFAVLAFAFFAIAGIAIDLGMASLAQQQMQVAVDPAALEAIRLRDYNVYQHYSDQGRRPKVSNLVRLIFDDDLHPTGGTSASGSGVIPGMPIDNRDELQLGAGTTLKVVDQGPGPLAPGGVIDTSTRTWDDPVLQGNVTMAGGAVASVVNAEYGDLVSGTYKPNQPHEEDVNYHRADFDVATGAAKWEALGFLVRMRRTTGANPLDNITNQSSRGPTIPFLWSLGSLMLQAPGDSWDPRRDGISVRATAVAVGRPALRASPAPIDPATGLPIVSENESGAPMLGLHPVALSIELWTALNPGTSWAPSINYLWINGGTLRSGSTTGPIQGYLVSTPSVTSVGKPVQELSGVQMPTILRPGFVAIYASINGTSRIVGYGFADAGFSTSNPGGVRVQLRQGILAPGGSSTPDVRVWVAANGVSAQIGSDTPQLNASEWQQVFERNSFLAYGGDNNAPTFAVVYDHTKVRPGTLMAPALAR